MQSGSGSKNKTNVNVCPSPDFPNPIAGVAPQQGPPCYGTRNSNNASAERGVTKFRLSTLSWSEFCSAPELMPAIYGRIREIQFQSARVHRARARGRISG